MKQCADQIGIHGSHSHSGVINSGWFRICEEVDRDVRTRVFVGVFHRIDLPVSMIYQQVHDELNEIS